jgi:N-acetylated-alpha-linked acidic dipeptidase
MLKVERNWLNQEGIPGRPWFKHTLYGARYTYAHLELPGLTEAVEQADWPRAKQQTRILEDAVDRNIKLVEGLASRLQGRVATTSGTPVH